MFGKLKEKLKDALSIFSRKTEEEAEEKIVEKVIEKQVVKEKTEKPKPESKKPVKAEKKKEVTQKKIEDKKKEIVLPKKTEEKEEVLTPKSEPKSSFFSKLKQTFTKKSEEKREEVKIPEPAVGEVKAEQEVEKQGFFEKVKQTLTTKTISAEKFDELFWELELALLENNVSVEVMEKIKVDLKRELVEKPLPRNVLGKIQETLQETLSEVLSYEPLNLIQKIKQKSEKPYIIAFFGINGSGKTTSIAKLTHYLQQHQLSVLLAAADTFRAAAIQQLEEHANRLGVKMIKHDYGADAAAVAFDAVKYAQKNQIDVVLIDTAGRLHSNTNLMAELGKIIRVTKPDMNIFVGESITGNDCIEQARRFNELVELDGVILTKADVDEKGGAPLSISYTIKKPILFIGTGQKYEDLTPFTPSLVLDNLGLGEVES